MRLLKANVSTEKQGQYKFRAELSLRWVLSLPSTRAPRSDTAHYRKQDFMPMEGQETEKSKETRVKILEWH